MASRRFFGRSLARSQALQLLFQAEATDREVVDVLAGPYALSQEDEPLDEFGERLALGADQMRPDLDAVIGLFSTNWSVGRMPTIDRNLLRLALFEMLEVEEVAVAVTIDESVELAKAYGTNDSSRFVNGLLGRIAREMDKGVDVVGEAREHEAEIAAEQRLREEESAAQEDSAAEEEAAEAEVAAREAAAEEALVSEDEAPSINEAADGDKPEPEDAPAANMGSEE